MVPELFDVVHQAGQLPLPIHFLAPAQRETGEPLVVPLLAFDALDGSFTPSMARSSRPISPWRSHTSSTWVKSAWASIPRLLMKCATVVKCGALSPETAMNSTLVRQAVAMDRELISPRE